MFGYIRKSMIGAAFILICFACALAHAEAIYTITYDFNGGNGYAPPVSKLHDEDIRITEQYPWCNPRTFMGWSTNPEASEGEYLPGDIFSENKDTTLYAVWRDAPDPGIVRAGESYRIPTYNLINDAGYSPRMYVKIVVEKDGFYTFQSTSAPLKNCFWGGQGLWEENTYMQAAGFDEINQNEDFSATAWLQGGKIYYLAYMDFHNEDMTFDVFSVQDAAYGLGVVEGERKFSFDNKLDRKSSVYYSFSVSEDGTYNIRSTDNIGKIYRSETNDLYSIKENGKWELVAPGQWTADRANFTISADLKAGTVYYLKVFDIGEPLSFSITDRIYTLTYDFNGGTGYAPPVSKLHDENIRITEQYPWYNPRTFMGWSTNPEASEGEYLPGDIFSANADTTLYAVWRDAPDPGIIRAGKSYRIPTYNLINDAGYSPRMYVKIVVENDGLYTLQSTSAPLRDCFWGGQGFWDEKVSNQVSPLEEINGGQDFSVTAWLQSDKVYYLAYMDFHREDMTFVVSNKGLAELIGVEQMLPDELTIINDGAFENSAFESVLIPEKVQSIGSRAFASCKNLKKVYITSGTTSIGTDAFADCIDGIVLYGPENSTVSEYAQSSGLLFEPIYSLIE